MRRLKLESGETVTSYFYPFTQSLLYLVLLVGVLLIVYDLVGAMGFPLALIGGGG